MTDRAFTKFEARVLVEGPFSSDCTAYDAAALLKLALQHALVSLSAEKVAELVNDVTAKMLHSLACSRREAGDVVCLKDSDPDGYNGFYQLAVGRGEPTDCMVCESGLCQEWPTLHELSESGEQTGNYAYHISECGMLDVPRRIAGLTKEGSEKLSGHIARTGNEAILPFETALENLISVVTPQMNNNNPRLKLEPWFYTIGLAGTTFPASIEEHETSDYDEVCLGYVASDFMLEPTVKAENQEHGHG